MAKVAGRESSAPSSDLNYFTGVLLVFSYTYASKAKTFKFYHFSPF